MLDRLVEDWRAGTNCFDRPGEYCLGLFAGRDLMAVGGLNLDPYAACAGTGRIRHLYVRSDKRRAGHGSALLTHLILRGRSHFDTLRLRTGNPIAALCYEAHGFQPIDEPEATHMLVLRSFERAD